MPYRHLTDTIGALVARELRMRYKGSFFGLVWALLSPLGTVVVLQFVFTEILPVGRPQFAAFIYSALLPWTWLQTAVQAGSTAFSDNRDLVRTPFFTKALLPCAITSTNFLLYLLALPVLVALIGRGGLQWTPALLALPLVWVVQAVLTLGFTLLIAAVGVLVRDVQHLMNVVLLFWFYLTPIFYDIKDVPPHLAGWFALNPMAAIVSAHRSILLHGQRPDWDLLAVAAATGIAILVCGLLTFRALEDVFVEQV